MKLTVLQRRNDPGFHPLSAIFQAPGGTLGRSADNHLTLPDGDRGICRVQAAVRISDDACYLVNLSGMGSVSINGRTITRDQEVPLSPGDELAIGPYTLRAEDPDAPAAAVGAAMAGAGALQDPLLSEPDPLLESPLLEGVDLTPPSLQAAAPPAIAQDMAALARDMADALDTPPAPEPKPAPSPHVEPPGAAQAPDTQQVPAPHASPRSASFQASATHADPSPSSSAADDLPPGDIPSAHLPAADLPPVSLQPEGRDAFAAAPSGDEPFGELAPQGHDTRAPQSDPADVFSDLFGPGTLPVGSVPDMSAHPFDLESAQTRNPEDPLRQLPRGDANVSGAPRDPLDLLGSPDSDGTQDVFSDPSPSTLPLHDPLAPHRSDPVTDTLNARRDDDAGGHAARDHLREYGGYLRPARVKPQDNPPDDAAPPRRK